MSVWKFSFTTTAEAAEPLANTLLEAFTPGCEAAITTELERDGPWRVDALYEDKPDAQAICAFLGDVRPDLPQPEQVTVELVPDQDWVAQTLEGLPPVITKRFAVHGSHDRDKVPAGHFGIEIDAGQAFGTGHHETTVGCLAFVEDLLKTHRPSRAFDLGTGTGVVAIAIAKLAKVKVLASDIDPVSVQIAEENARFNQVGPFIRAVTAAGFRHAEIREKAPFDLIVANILARPLVSLAPAFRQNLLPEGKLILSGILQSQENMVANAMRMQGLRFVSRKRDGDWVTLLFERPAALPDRRYDLDWDDDLYFDDLDLLFLLD